VGAPNFIKQTLLDSKEQIDPKAITAEDFNAPSSSLNRSSRPKKKKIDKETSELNYLVDQMT
jgi:hypothetical protein